MHYPIDHGEQPIRLFKSDFLEFFTHITPVAVLVIWSPVVVFFLVRAVMMIQATSASWLILPAAFVIGLVLWTFSEYMLHRFLFHYQPKSERAQKIFYLFHGVHHHQPQCKTRLVMPPVVSIPMALIIYGLFVLIFNVLLRIPVWLPATFAGFMVGYLCYDMIHYATHHFAMRNGIWKELKRYHLKHHYKTPEQRFGVSSPLWDIVFGTRPTA